MSAVEKEARDMGFSNEASKVLDKFSKTTRKPMFDLNRLKYEAIMQMLFEWRHAEVNASAIDLGIRPGDADVAKSIVAEKEKRLRIYVDSQLPLGGFKPRKP